MTYRKEAIWILIFALTLIAITIKSMGVLG
jgi:hypothetical protein